MFLLFSIPDGKILQHSLVSSKRARQRIEEDYYTSNNGIALIQYKGKRYIQELNKWGNVSKNPRADKSIVQAEIIKFIGGK